MNRFRLHPVPLLAGVLVVVLTLHLGNWQVGRALEKTALQAKFDSASASRPVPVDRAPRLEWQTVEVRGAWHPQHTILLDNRVHDGRVGYHVVTPLRTEEPEPKWFLVNRGWVPAGRDRTQLPEVAAPEGLVTLTARMRLLEERPFTLAPEAGMGRVWQVLDLAKYRERTGLPIADLVLQQTGGPEDGLVREWPAPNVGIERHRGYALQWYGLATLAFGLTGWYVWNGLGRARRDDQDRS